MPEFQGFVGPYAQSRFVSWDAEQTINRFVKLREKGNPKSDAILAYTPGKRPLTAAGPGPIRAQFQQDNRAFMISGDEFYEISGGWLPILRGSVALDPWPATISSSGTGGNQLFITSGGLGYIFDLLANTLVQITDDAFPNPVRSGLFFDSYFVALHAVEGTFHISEQYDGLQWNGLDFGTDSNASDLIVAMARSHDVLWLMGTKHSTPWVNTGRASFPFEPVPGTLVEEGISPIWSIVGLDNTILWVGKGEHGQGVVWRANGYTPMRISTTAIEEYIQALAKIEDGLAFAYQEDGHLFYELYFPVAHHTLVYDVSTNLWHQRAIWDINEMRWHPDVARNHMFAFGKHVVGDRQSGTLYHQSMSFFDDYLNIQPGTLANSGQVIP